MGGGFRGFLWGFSFVCFFCGFLFSFNFFNYCVGITFISYALNHIGKSAHFMFIKLCFQFHIFLFKITIYLFGLFRLSWLYYFTIVQRIPFINLSFNNIPSYQMKWHHISLSNTKNNKKSLKIPKEQSESVNRKRTDNTIAKRKSAKHGQFAR